MRKNFFLPTLCAGALLLIAPSAPKANAENAPQRIEITAQRFLFTPNEITIKKGEPVVLVLKSADVAHGLGIKGLPVEMKVQAGGTTETQFTPNQAGDFNGKCIKYCGHGHGSMKFKVHVVD